MQTKMQVGDFRRHPLNSLLAVSCSPMGVGLSVRESGIHTSHHITSHRTRTDATNDTCVHCSGFKAAQRPLYGLAALTHCFEAAVPTISSQQ
jgi:hypothetical protein